MFIQTASSRTICLTAEVESHCDGVLALDLILPEEAGTC
jgi:hypothetical protein